MFYRDRNEDYSVVEKDETISTKEYRSHEDEKGYSFKPSKKLFMGILAFIFSILALLPSTMNYKIVVYKCKDKEDIASCQIIHEDLNGLFHAFLNYLGG